MQRIVAAFTLTFCLITGCVAPARAIPGHGDSYELWRVRSQALTDDLLKDAGQLSPARRAVLLARLAQRWWPEDQARARHWFQSATEVVEQVPNKENSDERRERIAAAQVLLKTVARLDPALTPPLVKLLTPDTQWTDPERTQSAEWLINSATDMVAADVKRANQLASLALRIGPPNDIASYLFALRNKDPKLADAIFTQALSLAKQQPFPVQILNTLNYAAFPMQRGYARPMPIPPDNLRSELLLAEIEFLNAYPIDDDNRGSMCACVSGFIAPMFSEFERLLPTQAVVVRQAIGKCETAPPLVRQQLDDRPLNTTEDLLKAADDTKDVRARTLYEFRAANLARDARNYDLALKILDGMGKEERQFMDDVWDSYRWDWAAQGALDHYQRGRLAEMNNLLNTVPSNLQPFGKIAFLRRLREQKDAEPAPIVQLLNEALTGLRNSSVSETDKHNWYFALLSSTVRYQPADASGVLKAAVSSLNKTKDRKTLDTLEFAEGVAEPLLEMDEYVVKDSLASITLVETRAQLRLVLLDATLRHMKSSQ